MRDEAPALTRRLTVDALRVFSGQTVWSVASMLAGVAVVRALGPAGKGQLAYAMTAIVLVTTALSGPTTAAMMAVARRGVDRSAAERAVFRLTLRVATAIAVVMGAIGAFVHGQSALLGAACAVIPAALGGAMQTMLQYRGEVKRAVVTQQIAGTGLAVATAAIVVAGGGLVGAFAAWTATSILALLAGRSALRATSPPGKVATNAIGRTGLLTTAIAVVGYLNLTIDLYIVAAMRPAAELGIYALAVASAEFLWQLNRALIWPALGPIARLDRPAAARLAGRIARDSIALVGGAAVIAWFAAPSALRWVYGDAFASTAGVLRLLLPGIVAMAGEGALGSYVLLSLGRGRALLITQIASTAICGIVCVVGLPRIGIAAAALATTTTYCAAFVVVLVLAVRGGLPVRALFRG